MPSDIYLAIHAARNGAAAFKAPYAARRHIRRFGG